MVAIASGEWNQDQVAGWLRDAREPHQDRSDQLEDQEGERDQDRGPERERDELMPSAVGQPVAW